jgi:hypothetical protein
MKIRPALTLIELLISIAAISIIAIPAFLSFNSLRTRQALAVSAENFGTVVKRAHIFSRENKTQAAWGVKWNSSSDYSLVYGTPASYLVNSTYRLDYPATFDSNFGIIWFNQETGDMANTATATVRVPPNTGIKIDISKTGIINTTNVTL